MNSSKQKNHQFLATAVPAREAEKLLLDLANLPADWPLMRGEGEPAKAARILFHEMSAYLVKKYPDVFCSLPYPITPPRKARWKIHPLNLYILARIQELLQLAWDAPDVREREWYIFQARLRHHHSTVYFPLRDKRVSAFAAVATTMADIHPEQEAALQGEIDREFRRVPPEEETAQIAPPPLTPFEQIMYFHFHQKADKARHCANAECPAPYFFSSRKGQIYCGEECAVPAQRAHKRAWWKRNGEKWRLHRAKRGIERKKNK